MQPLRRPLSAALPSFKTLHRAAWAASSSSDCFSCQLRSIVTAPSLSAAVLRSQRQRQPRPFFQRRLLVEDARSNKQDEPARQRDAALDGGAKNAPTATPKPSVSPDPPSASAELPSESQAARSTITVVLHKYMDRVVNYLSFASHRVNTLTGTDYSAIASLRESIAVQEEEVKNTQRSVTEARAAYEKALATQAASQREVVQLLERKHSWSAEDLERYMSLIRSEHVNEQAVSAAREDVGKNEAKLEAARQQVEKGERKQYHEEQIWSDTIRRNSSWVTFGLMGVNMLLLIANLVVIEPWRRRRMVRELEAAMDQRALPGVRAAAPVAQTETEETAALEDAATLQGDGELAATAPEYLMAEDNNIIYINGEPVERLPPVAPLFDEDGYIIEDFRPQPARPLRARLADLFRPEAWSAAWEHLVRMVHGAMSEQQILLRKVDLTLRVAEAFALGMTSMMIISLLFPLVEEF